jgi:hypothetical protein
MKKKPEELDRHGVPKDARMLVFRDEGRGMTYS